MRIKKKKKKAGTEAQTLQAVVNYLKLQYPHVIYSVDYGAGLRMSIGAAVRQKKLSFKRGFPDLFIYKASGGFHGLGIELKTKGIRITNGKGKFTKEHYAEQAVFHELLRKEGYMAEFCIGFDEAKLLVDNYIKGFPL